MNENDIKEATEAEKWPVKFASIIFQLLRLKVKRQLIVLFDPGFLLMITC